MAFSFALGCFLCSAAINLLFYLETGRFAPGQQIRPMLEVSALGLSGAVSVLGGGGIALHASFLSLRRKQWLQFSYALLAFVIAWIPFFAGFSIFERIITIRKLILEN